MLKRSVQIMGTAEKTNIMTAVSPTTVSFMPIFRQIGHTSVLKTKWFCDILSLSLDHM